MRPAPGARTNTETMTSKSGRQEQSRTARYLVHDRHHVRRRVDHARPGLLDTHTPNVHYLRDDDGDWPATCNGSPQPIDYWRCY